MNRELICIGCPMGCMLTVAMDGDKVISVSGNTCPKGEKYAIEEVTDPRRIVTSTVKVAGGEAPVVSVKTKQAIPKAKIGLCMQALKGLECKAPVEIGDVLYLDGAQGIEIVATKKIDRAG